jgi:hypothetical protein
MTMNFLKASAIGLLSVLLVSCSSINISSDYDPSRDFSSYKTYRWARGREKNPRNVLAREPLLSKRVQFAVDKVLQSKGLWWGPYGGYTTVSHYTEGTLVVDIVDRAEKELSWRGIATGTVRSRSDPESAREDIEYAIEEILYEFPPRR